MLANGNFGAAIHSHSLALAIDLQPAGVFQSTYSARGTP
jgi:hypothetical protein